jgi:hypothetical protein
MDQFIWNLDHNWLTGITVNDVAAGAAAATHNDGDGGGGGVM